MGGLLAPPVQGRSGAAQGAEGRHGGHLVGAQLLFTGPERQGQAWAVEQLESQQRGIPEMQREPGGQGGGVG